MFDPGRRHLVVHSAHKTVGVSLVPIDLQADRELAGWRPGWVEKDALRVCLVTGPGDEPSDDAAEVLAECLERPRSGACRRVCCQTLGDWSGLDHLAECDCAVLFLDRRFPAEWLAAVARLGQRGGGMVGVRAADGDLLRPRAGGCHLFGVECQGRHVEPCRPEVQIVPARRLHPVVEGVHPFTAGANLWKSRPLIADVETLLTASTPGGGETVAWVRPYRVGRGFCTTLGHPTDFRQPSFLRLLANAVFWTAGENA